MSNLHNPCFPTFIIAEHYVKVDIRHKKITYFIMKISSNFLTTIEFVCFCESVGDKRKDQGR